MMPNTAFDDAMLDFTKPGSRASFLQGMMDQGVSGWMADFDEGLPLDVRLPSSEDCVAAHNRYPELWAQVNREFVDEWKACRRAARGGEDDDGLVFFVRSWFRESSRWAMLFWELILTEATALAPNLTERYFQVTLYSFDGIL